MTHAIQKRGDRSRIGPAAALTAAKQVGRERRGGQRVQLALERAGVAEPLADDEVKT